MNQSFHRRHLLKASAASFVAGSLATGAAPASAFLAESSQPLSRQKQADKVRYCLNTSTIRESGLDLIDEIELAATTGYDGIEPWIREIQSLQERGVDLGDVAKKLSDHGLTVENAIGFANWIVDDENQRKAGLEQAKRDMELVRKLGGKRIAAPPVGATNIEGFDLFKAAERYGELLRIGRDIGVTPQLELWGFSKTLSRMGELVFVAAESGDADASLLPDIYHIYKGGSDFQGLKLIDPVKIPVFHINDYPDQPPRETIGDADRVYPGDGIAPLTEVFSDLLERGFTGTISLELFNPEYWKMDPQVVAKTGLEKMKATIAKAAEA